MEIGTVFYLFIIIIIIFSHCTRWWWWYCSILLKVQIHIYMYSKLDITAKVTIPKTVLQSSAGCTLWLKVETVFSFVFFFFFSFLFFLSCGLSDGDLVVSFICFIRYCWKHSQCLWVLWLQYCADWITKMILLGLGYKTPQIFFMGVAISSFETNGFHTIEF